MNDNDAADGGGDGGDYEVHTSILILQYQDSRSA